MSTTVCMHPIVAAIRKADDIIGEGRVWRPQNQMQTRFLTEFFDRTRNEVLGISEIESIASWSAEDINRFLQERGFSITLDDFDEDTFGVAATLILLLKWKVEGMKEKFRAADGKTYDGVRMENGMSYYTSVKHPKPVVCIATKSGDQVFMTVMETPPTDFDLVSYVEQIQASLEHNREFGDLVFPMVDLDQLVDISWLLNMETTANTGQQARISQAKQQTIFKMNDKGALLKSAAAAAITLEFAILSKPDLVIDRPFLVWIVRDGLAKPLLVAHITQENWTDPGDLM